MDFANSRISDQLPLIDVIQPQSINAGSASGAWVDMSTIDRALWTIMLGVTDCTLDAKLQQATSSGGAGAKDITGKAITQLLATDDNHEAQINLHARELDKNNGFRWVRLTLTASNATGALVAASGRGANIRYGPDSGADIAALKETVK